MYVLFVLLCVYELVHLTSMLRKRQKAYHLNSLKIYEVMMNSPVSLRDQFKEISILPLASRVL